MAEQIRNRFDLSGKVAIITGASKGIGASIARGLAEFGARVVVSSRKQEAVDVVSKELLVLGYESLGLACHVGDADARSKLVTKTLEEFGRIDILVNNAAINPFYGPIANMDPGAYQKTLDININAAMALSNLIYPSMKVQGSGSIIHISSIEGFHPGKGMSAYSISKAALNMLTYSQAVEWGRDGIRVNAIAPGLIKTKFSSALWNNEEIMRHVKENVPLGRIADPDEIAGLATFLASDAASYCTGGIYLADGGFVLSTGL